MTIHQDIFCIMYATCTCICLCQVLYLKSLTCPFMYTHTCTCIYLKVVFFFKWYIHACTYYSLSFFSIEGFYKLKLFTDLCLYILSYHSIYKLKNSFKCSFIWKRFPIINRMLWVLQIIQQYFIPPPPSPPPPHFLFRNCEECILYTMYSPRYH